MNQSLFRYIAHSPTAYQAAAHTALLLQQAGYRELLENEAWKIERGKGYYVMRNGSSLIAFRMPQTDFAGFMMAAAHGDSPCFKIKENPEVAGGVYVQLGVEKYGGMLCASWMDRPLSVAGRILVRTPRGVAERLVDLQKPVVLIPNVPIHMNRNANEGMKYNPAVDMLPLYGMGERKGTFRSMIAAAAFTEEEDILSTDLFVYNPQEGVEWGDFISAPRLDDLQCAFGSLQGFLRAREGRSLPVFCLFDNEEVGNQTKQGADSTFLTEVLQRICAAFGKTAQEYSMALANSLLLSCDNAHAQHPNHPEYYDPGHAVRMNRGIVIKYNANQRYSTDAVSSALFQRILKQAGIPYQFFHNRSDLAGGTTLGNAANTQVSVNTVDIGLAQLAMHSAYETAGAEDTEWLVRGTAAFYESAFQRNSDGEFIFE